MPKKRIKKYNPRKSNDITVNQLVTNLALMVSLDKADGKVNGFDMKNNRVMVSIPKLLADVIGYHHFVWTIVLVVHSLESNGKERTVTELVQSPFPACHTELITSLNSQHQSMIANEKARGNDPYNAAWVAYPQKLGKLSEADAEIWTDKAVHMIDIYRNQ